MSNRVMTWVFDDVRIPPREKLVLLALADQSNDDGGAVYPRQAVIGERTGLSERAVRDCLTKLKQRGLVDWISRGKKNGGRGSNIYQIRVPWIESTEESIPAIYAGLVC